MRYISHPTARRGSRRAVRPPSGPAVPAPRARRDLPGLLVRGTVTTLTWLGSVLVLLLATLLVGVSLIWGPTNWPVAVLLLALWLVFVALLVGGARAHSRRWLLAAVAGLLVLSPLAVIASQLSAYTPTIVDAHGQPVPGSIATLERVELNGSRQWISIRAKRADAPVLLFLAGGPGGSQLATARHNLHGLEDHFVVVNWEQPGAGKSYNAVDRATLTPERYVEDGHALVQYLRARFAEDKVYVLGESWGSALGILLVQRYPELFHAFMGTGQMVAFTETDRLDYEFALRWARERGDTAKVATLEAQGPPPYYGRGVAWKQVSYLLDTYAFMNQNPAIADGTDNTIRDLLSPEYGLYDKAAYLLGVLNTIDVVYPQLWSVDFRTQATTLQVPVYFLIGRHDINAPVALTEEYYRLLSAPHKQIIWFEHSGHTPWTREPDRFVNEVVNTVLADTLPQR